MATDLEALRDRVESLLADSSNAEWSTSELDDAIRLALHELSRDLPVLADATVDAADDTWEYSMASMSGLVDVVEVWYPYSATDASDKKPSPVSWRMIDDDTLLLDESVEPDGEYDLRVFYTKMQSLAGLDSALETTLSAGEKAALVIGAAGYAAIAKARERMNEVTLGVDVPRTLQRWGEQRLAEFRQRVAALAERAATGEDARVSGWDA
ncbi:MAG: hypothetical protein H5T68_12425 [Chloroflexi bacterium]|nr:hypothetical protein [Chloroflexota bacterium]